MAEKCILSDISIIFSNFECNTDTSAHLRSGIKYLQYDLRAEVLSITIVRAVFLRTSQVTEHTSAVLRIVRRLI